MEELRSYLARRIAQLQTRQDGIRIEAMELSDALRADGAALGIGPVMLESLTDQLKRVSLGANVNELFEAFREWMLEDPGGPSLVSVIQSWPGFQEWSLENWQTRA